MALASTAKPSASSTLTRVGFSSGSSDCSRDSSMICCTSRPSRSVSRSIRSANRLTASGSSDASATASDSSRMAPTGVLSSWLTFATKSRRTSSMRRSRVRSSARARTRCEPSGATRAVTCRDGSPGRPMTSSTSRICPSRRTCVMTWPSSGLTTWEPRTSPKAYAGADALTTTSALSTTIELLRRTDSTAATSGGTTGGSTVSATCCCRSLMCQASTAPPATTAPMIAARNAWNVGSTVSMVLPGQRALRRARPGFETFTRRS